jgi:acetyl-CoA acetyltransferase
MPLSGTYAIAGLGLTSQGRVFDHGYMGFAVEAVRLALEDAQLPKSAIDGLLVNPGVSWRNPLMASAALQQALGLSNLGLSLSLNAGGATAGAMVQHACEAIEAGLATTVACVFSDAPLKPPRTGERKQPSGAAFGGAKGWDAAYGYFGVNARYAMVAMRHIAVYGTTQDQLARVAITQRDWARSNPAAEMKDKPLTLADYHASRWIVEPFHLFDCCLVSNGGACVIVTTAERAKDLAQPAVRVLGFGQGHPGTDPVETLSTGARQAGAIAFAMAKLSTDDVDIAQLYDCYTFTVLITLEDYGFCAKGEAGAFVESGATARGGRLPVNTGGGQLSSFYMWGMTPIVEAVTQLRGHGGERQVESADIALVSGNGGVLATHSCLLLGRDGASG